jgi:hypothetical protein
MTEHRRIKGDPRLGFHMPPMSPYEKAMALVEGGLADDLEDAADQLFDMGEIDNDEHDELCEEAAYD